MVVVVLRLCALAHVELRPLVAPPRRREDDAVPTVLQEEEEIARELERAVERRRRDEDVDELRLARHEVGDLAAAAHVLEKPTRADEERMLVGAIRVGLPLAR